MKSGLFNQTRILWVVVLILCATVFVAIRSNRELTDQVDALQYPPVATLSFSGAESITIELVRRANFFSPVDDPRKWVVVGETSIDLPEGIFSVSFGERTWPLLMTHGLAIHWDLTIEPKGFGRVPSGPGLSGLDWKLSSPTNLDGAEHNGSGFLLSMTEVAVGEYAAFLEALKIAGINSNGFHDCCSDMERGLFPDGCPGHQPIRGSRDLWTSQNLPEYQRRAVREVNLLDAMAYCGYLTAKDPKEVRYRLPTKSEWERAARGVDGRPFPWGVDPLLPLREGVAGLRTTVDSHPSLRSPFGHLHMGSGVSEWSLTREGKLRYYVMGRSFDLPADRIHVGYAVGESPIVRSASTGFRVLQEPAK